MSLLKAHTTQCIDSLPTHQASSPSLNQLLHTIEFPSSSSPYNNCKLQHQIDEFIDRSWDNSSPSLLQVSNHSLNCSVYRIKSIETRHKWFITIRRCKQARVSEKPKNSYRSSRDVTINTLKMAKLRKILASMTFTESSVKPLSMSLIHRSHWFIICCN